MTKEELKPLWIKSIKLDNIHISYEEWLEERLYEKIESLRVMSGTVGKLLSDIPLTEELALKIFNAGCFFEQGTTDQDFKELWENINKRL